MISHEELDEAVAAGAITAEAAAALRHHVARRRHAPAADEEHFRLMTGFNDFFVVIAGLLVLLSVNWLFSHLVVPVAGDLVMSALAWNLAEIFVRRRHLALPAIVLTLVWMAGVFLAAKGLMPDGALQPLVAMAASCVAAALHWRRFQVPITWAAAAAALAYAVGASLPDAWTLPAVALCGLATLAAAVAWDMSDRPRLTRRADVAFWLHLLAAPLLVHAGFNALRVLEPGLDAGRAVAIGLAYLGLCWVSLVLDRRALMVSALGYVLAATVMALDKHAHSPASLVLVPLLIGIALLWLSARWEDVRGWVVAPLPVGLKRRLAPTQREPA